MSREAEDPPREYASSPCYAHEFETPALASDALAVRLNELLEGERAGARGLIDMTAAQDDAELVELLDEVARDEARFCAMLGRHLERLGFEASRRTGVFYDKLAQRRNLVDQLRLLDRGQSAVVRVLDELLPGVADCALADDLREMRDVHVENIRRCAAYLPDADADADADA